MESIWKNIGAKVVLVRAVVDVHHPPRIGAEAERRVGAGTAFLQQRVQLVPVGQPLSVDRLDQLLLAREGGEGRVERHAVHLRDAQPVDARLGRRVHPGPGRDAGAALANSRRIGSRMSKLAPARLMVLDCAITGGT